MPNKQSSQTLQPAEPPSHTVPETLLSYAGRGMTSKQEILVEVKKGAAGSGIVFFVKSAKHNNEYVEVPSRAEFVVNTLRNVVLGRDGTRLCIVEHFLAAVSLWALDDIQVYVDGPEMPLGDGSASFWVELLKKTGIACGKSSLERIQLTEPVYIVDKDRSLIALPDDHFSATYLMDWDHPAIGKRWQTWDASMSVESISDARTFGSLKEHEMLGLSQDVVSLTADGFTQPLRFADEPVRHKILDLIGDLALTGVNPLRINARFISIKGGHALDVQLASKIAALISK